MDGTHLNPVYISLLEEALQNIETNLKNEI